MKKSSVLLLLAVLLAVCASFWLGSTITRKKYEGALKRTDTVLVERWVRDTVYEPKDSIIFRYKTAYLQLHDTTEVHDTTTVLDSVWVDVPLTEKHYASENYRATVRGFNAELVDIWVKQRETFVTIPYRKHWSVTVGPQVGLGITPQGWQPYAGAGITFGYSF